METQKYKRPKFKLGELLSTIDQIRQPLDLVLSKVVNNNAKDIELNYAETILLIEGSQTGVADCTLPPYVLYESNVSGDINDAIIRSELLEWYLDGTISKTLVKSGFLKIEGATILSSLDYNANKLTLVGDTEMDGRDERYSLDLSSKSILIDLNCSNCKFYKGISLKDSYTENLLFEKVEIGKSYEGKTSNSVSFDATNATINGDLKLSSKFEKAPFNHNPQKEPDILFAIKGKIILDNAKIDSSLSISNDYDPNRIKSKDIPTAYGRIGDIQGLYLQTKVAKITNCFIQGNISFDFSNFEQEFSFFNSVLYEKQSKDGSNDSSLSCTYINTKILDLRSSIFYGPAHVYGSEMDILSCDGANFFGTESLDASGIKSKAVFLRRGFFAQHGVKLHKSEIAGDLDCKEGFFGFNIDENFFGVSLSFRNSSARNVNFSDGFISLGQLDISSSTIDNLYCRQGIFIDPYEYGYLQKNDHSKTYAIYANNCLINQKINFNLSKANTENLIPEDFFEEKNPSVNHKRNIRERYNKIVYQNLLNRNSLSRTFDLIKIYSDKENSHNFTSSYTSIIEAYDRDKKDYENREVILDKEVDKLLTELSETKRNLSLIKKEYEEASEKLSSDRRDLENNNTSDYEQKIDKLYEMFEEYQYSNFSKQIILKVKIKEYEKIIEKNEQQKNKLYADLFENFALNNSKVFELIVTNGLFSLEKSNISLVIGLSLIKAIEDIQSFLESKNLLPTINQYSIIYGEAFFEEIKIEGEMDCAAAIFYRKAIDETISVKRYAWQKEKINDCVNSLTLSHSNINGTLYLNCGDGRNQLPFLSHGEVDLQYSFFKQLSITPSLATAKETRWKLIGATYDTIYTYHQKTEIQKVTLESCDWIYPYHSIDNYRQPYEQLSNALFKNGDDVSAREVIVYKIPSRNFLEASIMTLIIRPFFWIGFPLQRALVGLLILIISGLFYFQYGANRGYIIPADETKAYIHQRNASPKKISFERLSYTLQKLVPFVDGEQEENFTASYRRDDVDSTIFLIYYNAYTLLSAYWIAMILLSIARMRKNSS